MWNIFKSGRAFAGLVLSLIGMVGTVCDARAQVLYGSVVGRVVDQTESAIPQAVVRLTNVGTNQSREITTDDNGNFTFTSVPGGTYDVSVTKANFQTYTLRGLAVTPDATARVEAVLKVGGVEETVEVTAAAGALQTDSAEVRGEINTTSLTNIPVNVNRNYQSLLITVPGVTPPTTQHSVAANPSRGLSFNVNGTTRNSNAVRIDGALANNVWLPHVTAYVPSLEAIEAVSVITGSAEAEQGLSGGSAVNVQIKSGTNDLHGSLFGFHTNNALKAKPFFLPAGQRKPKYIYNNVGGSLGGPIIRDKLFYFGSWEGSYNRQFANTFATVPTAAMRAGDFSASPNPIYDPLTGNSNGSGRTPFPGNIIPPSRIDPIAQKIIAGLPLPTFPNLLANNYFAGGSYAVDRSTLDAKISWVPGTKVTVSGRLGWLRYDMNNPPAFGDLGGPPVASAGGRAGHAYGNVYSTTYSLNYLFRPNFVIDSYVGYTLSQTNHDPVRLDEKVGLDFLGLPGTNTNPLAGGWPRFSISSYTDIGTPGSSTAIRYNDSQFEYTANASWTLTAHTVRFGVDFSRIGLNHYEAENGPGTFFFTGGATALSGGPSPNQFNSFAQFLLGLTSLAQNEALPFDDNQLTSRQTSLSMYVKDQWQASPKLTLSYGVRWDYFPMGTRKSRGLERYDFDANQMLICGVGGVPTDCGYNIEQKNFSPRVGLAYRATDTVVLRAGYGINYDPYPLAFVRNMLTNYPNFLAQTIPAPNAFQPATLLRNGIPPLVAPDISLGRVPVPLTFTVRTLPQNVKRGYIQSWNLSVQKQLWGGFTAQAAYVGTRQVKINQRLDLNAGQVPGAGLAGQPFFVRFGRTALTELLTPVGHNVYDALQTTLQRRFANGFQLNVAYTFSKAIGLCCDDLSEGPPAIQIPRFMRLARGLLPSDRTHVFSSTVVAQLPFGRDRRWLRSGPLSMLAGGWQANALISAYSGLPFTVTASAASLNAPGNNQTANLVRPRVAILGGVGPNEPYFDPLAFAPVTTPTFGSAGYNILRGPSVFNIDFSLFRDFRLSERWKAQFRAEALNLTNTPHFANPSANVSNLQLNPDGTIRSLGGFGVITSTANTGREGIDERVIRFGLRLSF